jgi:hypothetical protein
MGFFAGDHSGGTRSLSERGSTSHALEFNATTVHHVASTSEGARAMDRTVEVIAFYASATQNALVTLSKCLMDDGALKPGQFSSAIKPRQLLHHLLDSAMT